MLNDWLVVAICIVLVYLFWEATADSDASDKIEGLGDGPWASAHALNNTALEEANNNLRNVYNAHAEHKNAVAAFIALTAVGTRINNMITNQTRKYSALADTYSKMIGNAAARSHASWMELRETTQREKNNHATMDKELDDEFNKIAQNATTDLQDARNKVNTTHNTLVSLLDSSEAFVRKHQRILADKNWGAVPNNIRQINESIAGVRTTVTNGTVSTNAEITNRYNMVTRAIDSRAIAIERGRQSRDAAFNTLVNSINENLSRMPASPAPAPAANRLEFKPVTVAPTFATVPKLPTQPPAPLRPNVPQADRNASQVVKNANQAFKNFKLKLKR